MKDLLTPTDESVLQMSAATLRSFKRGTLADELDRVAAKLEWAFIEARERGYDDAKSANLPSTNDLEADFRRWKELNPSADLRSAWIAGAASERNIKPGPGYTQWCEQHLQAPPCTICEKDGG